MYLRCLTKKKSQYKRNIKSYSDQFLTSRGIACLGTYLVYYCHVKCIRYNSYYEFSTKTISVTGYHIPVWWK